ncbi:response regulator [Desulfatirhabdium butyrativorans]|uniref:response regulator n=1 Tax=Desulfatirhabdium butyrativorans TaxID=340467 RepID=UPI000402B7F0|nr:response regulator [Desulfatirhabdium butyrativorans]
MSEKQRILVVDDSQLIRMQIRDELEGSGYEVIEAKNGLEAIIQVASKSSPDLITMDIEMPKLNGFETCKKLRESQYAKFLSKSEDRRIPIIFITGNDTLEDRKKGFELGAVDFIAKPFKKGEILAAVNKILGRSIVEQNIRALVADDNTVARKITAMCLRREGIQVLETEDGEEAYRLLSDPKNEIDILITDLVMPKMDGIHLCRLVRKELKQIDMPIIVLTAVSDLSEVLEVFRVGASDYLVKPFAKEELLARLGVHIERNRINKELRETIRLLEAAKARIEQLSITDPLTGCFNRGYFNKQFDIEYGRSIRYKRPLAVVMCDIDHFKLVNDTYGHQAGDRVLQHFVTVMQGALRKTGDWIARYGGEEFMVVMPETDKAAAQQAAERLRQSIEASPIMDQDREIRITASFGIAGNDPETTEPIPGETLLKQADDALYEAKKTGRNRVVLAGGETPS